MNAAAVAPVKVVGDQLREILVAELHESPWNPRQHYDPATIEELAASLRKGQLTPLVVRPRRAGGFEIGAGHRRRRAALKAGLTSLLCLVRDLDDVAFTELLNIENLQRDDLHPLEEAQGFRDLMARAGYDVAKIATRVGRSTRYVYDSLTLLKLRPDAKKLFLAGGFERGHAIELARLSPEWQQKALDRQINRYEAGAKGGLWEAERVEDEPGQPELRLDDKVKPVSVREFKTWVNDKVRVKPSEIDPVLFPETATALTAAAAQRERVIEITYEHVIWHEARDAKASRVYGAHAWRSASKHRPDPGWSAKPGKACAHSVLGVVVIGPGRGDAFRVCVAKDKCKVHWPEHVRRAEQAKKRAKTAPAKDGKPAARARDREAREEAARVAKEKAQEAERARWTKAIPQLAAALAAKVKAAPTGPTSVLGELVLSRASDAYGTSKKIKDLVSPGRTAEDLVRRVAWLELVGDLNSWRVTGVAADFKALGLDAQAIVDQAVPPPAAAKSLAKKKAKARR